jgi:hypothetical protein
MTELEKSLQNSGPQHRFSTLFHCFLDRTFLGSGPILPDPGQVFQQVM